MKRSGHVALAILGAAAFGLAGCQETATDAASFPDLDSCLKAATQDGWFTADDCRTTFAEAELLHEETAPRYDSAALCEEQHGEGNCQPDASASPAGGGGGSIFMPLMMGYLLGSALSGGRPVAQPVFGRAGGGYSTPAGTGISRLGASGKVPTEAFAKAPVTKGQPAMTRATVAQRGGFGATGAGRSTFSGG